MATSIIAALIDALVVAARAALPEVRVADGIGVTEDPGHFLLIGVTDPDSDGPDPAADSTQRWPHVGHATRDEEGYIRCVAVAWEGSSDQKAARDAVFAITAEVEDLLRVDPQLGLAQIITTGFGQALSLRQGQDPEIGAQARVSFSIHFRARL